MSKENRQVRRNAAREFLQADREERVRQLIDAICGRGWDAPSTANAELAEELLKLDRQLCHDDFALACATGEVDVVRTRLDAEPGLATREVGPRSWQPLLYAAYSVLARAHGAPAEAITRVGALLLERGASARASYVARIAGDAKAHEFPVLFACIHVSDNLRLAKLLLEAGADPNDDQSLYHAVERFDTDALELLFVYGLQPEWLSYCLLHQIDLGFLRGVRWFVDHGADPNVKHPWGLSALHWAVMRPGTDQIVELLLERGADARAKTPEGRTALDLAECHHGKVDVVSVLERYGAERGARSRLDELIAAAAHGDVATAQALATTEPELVRPLSGDQRSIVAAFAESGNAQGASILARLGFDLATTSWMGMSALHWAACRGNPSMMRDLLAAGAPFVTVEGFGTPFHTALYQRWSSFGYRAGEGDYVGVVKVLLAAGVEVPSDLRACGDAEIDALLGLTG